MPAIDHMQWLKSRGPAGYWLSIVAILLFRSEWSLALQSSQMALSFGTLSSIIAVGVAFLALIHHSRGWIAVRVYAFVNIWIFAALFLTHLIKLKPEGESIFIVLSLGSATIVWMAVFQYFKRTKIQRLFPPEPSLD